MGDRKLPVKVVPHFASLTCVGLCCDVMVRVNVISTCVKETW